MEDGDSEGRSRKGRVHAPHSREFRRVGEVGECPSGSGVEAVVRCAAHGMMTSLGSSSVSMMHGPIRLRLGDREVRSGATGSGTGRRDAWACPGCSRDVYPQGIVGNVVTKGTKASP